MNRDAFLIYLKDLRDLEFAKNAITKTYNREKDKFNDRARQLNQTNYHKLDDLGDPVNRLHHHLCNLYPDRSEDTHFLFWHTH